MIIKSKAYEFFFFLIFKVDSKGFHKVLNLIETGKKEGAKCVLGGKRLGNVGYFIEPTVFVNVTDDMTIAKEEVSVNSNFDIRFSSSS